MQITTDTRDRKPAVSNLPTSLIHAIEVLGLEHALDVATINRDCARDDLAALEDTYCEMVERGAQESRLIMAERNVDTARRHLLACEDALQALEREQDARTYAERLDDVHAEVLEVIEDATARGEYADPHALTKYLVSYFTARVRRFTRELARQRAEGMSTDHLADALTLMRCGLYVAMERPDVVARLTRGMFAAEVEPAPAPEGWGRRVAPPVATLPEGVEVAAVVESARVELLERALEEVTAVEEWERDVSVAMPPRELRAKWCRQWARDGATEARPGLRTLVEVRGEGDGEVA
jgi:hypothetical protein